MSRRCKLLLAAIYLASLYWLAAVVTFALRHPWMTNTEQCLHTWDALCWRTVAR